MKIIIIWREHICNRCLLDLGCKPEICEHPICTLDRFMTIGENKKKTTTTAKLCCVEMKSHNVLEKHWIQFIAKATKKTISTLSIIVDDIITLDAIFMHLPLAPLLGIFLWHRIYSISLRHGMKKEKFYTSKCKFRKLISNVIFFMQGMCTLFIIISCGWSLFPKWEFFIENQNWFACQCLLWMYVLYKICRLR